MFRKLVPSVSSAKFVGRLAIRNSIPISQRTLSTSLIEKERGEEAKYFSQQDALKKAALRAKLEKILELEDTDSTKQEVLGLFAKQGEEKGFLAKYGLDDWKFALPIGMMVGIPAVVNEVIVLSAETQVLAVFILVLSTAYTQVGGLIGQSLDEYSRDIAQKLKDVDENILSEVKSTITATEELLDLEADVKSVHSIVDDLSVAQADILNYSEEHKFREAILKKLDTLATMEETVTSSIRAKMLGAVKSDVISTFTNDKKAKEIALEQAIAVLMGGQKATLGKDVVGEAFTSSLKSYREAYAKNPAGDEILIQLQKDVAAVAVAPVVEGTGGNVYETHPISL